MPPKSGLWNIDNENTLIELVRERPILWDPSREDYKRTDWKDSHWEEVAKILGPQFSMEMVRTRFINMRGTFMDNIRREKDSKNRSSGKGAEEVYRPKWVHYAKLQFLRKSGAQSSSISSFDVSSPPTEESSEVLIQSPPVCDGLSPQCPSVSIHEDEVGEPENISPSNGQLPSSYSSSSTEKRKGDLSFFEKRGKKRSPVSEAVELMKEALKEPIIVPKLDAIEHFGQFVSASMRDMQPEDRKICQRRIMDIIHEYL